MQTTLLSCRFRPEWVMAASRTSSTELCPSGSKSPRLDVDAVQLTEAVQHIDELLLADLQLTDSRDQVRSFQPARK